MKKETVVTAIVFLGVGFLAGYIYDSQKNWSQRENAAVAAGQRGSGDASTAPGSANESTMPGLPEGHPPLETAARMKALEDQAAQNPQDPGPLLKLANLFYDQRMYEQAVTWYQKALELDPKNVNARTDLGTAYYNLGRPEEALQEYRLSLEIDPSHELTMFNMIIVNLEGKHDLPAARAVLEKLYKRDPNYPGLERLRDRLKPQPAAGAPSQP